MSDRWLIVGLGNPGSQYEKTRHNIGFMMVQALGERYGIKGQQDKKFNAMVGAGQLEGHSVLLVQPLTYMNLSGEAVGKILAYYKIPPEQLLVLYDDVALPVGKIRVRKSGSAGGQKGMKSIIQHLSGNEGFPRLRIGIGPPNDKWDMVDHVLSRFTDQETQWLTDYILPAAEKAVCIILSEGVEVAMNRCNGGSLLPSPPQESPPPTPPGESSPLAE